MHYDSMQWMNWIGFGCPSILVSLSSSSHKHSVVKVAFIRWGEGVWNPILLLMMISEKLIRGLTLCVRLRWSELVTTTFWSIRDLYFELDNFPFAFLLILFYMLNVFERWPICTCRHGNCFSILYMRNFFLCGLVAVRLEFSCESVGQGLSEVCNHKLRVWAFGRNSLNNICFSCTTWPLSLCHL